MVRQSAARAPTFYRVRKSLDRFWDRQVRICGKVKVWMPRSPTRHLSSSTRACPAGGVVGEEAKQVLLQACLAKRLGRRPAERRMIIVLPADWSAVGRASAASRRLAAVDQVAPRGESLKNWARLAAVLLNSRESAGWLAVVLEHDHRRTMIILRSKEKSTGDGHGVGSDPPQGSYRTATP